MIEDAETKIGNGLQQLFVSTDSEDFLLVTKTITQLWFLTSRSMFTAKPSSGPIQNGPIILPELPQLSGVPSRIFEHINNHIRLRRDVSGLQEALQYKTKRQNTPRDS